MGKGGAEMLRDKGRQDRKRGVQHFVPDSRWKHSEFIPQDRRDKTFVRDSRFGRDAPRFKPHVYPNSRRNASEIQGRTDRDTREEGRQTRSIQGLLWSERT